MDELLSTVQKAIELAEEEQAYDWKYCVTQSLLSGIGMFNIDQIVKYHKPILTSHTGDVQLETHISGNSNGQAQVEVLVTGCDECAKPICRSLFICMQACTTPVEGTSETLSDPAAFQARCECQHIQGQLDCEQNISDGHRLRAAALRNFLSLRQLMFLLGNIHTGIVFGSLIIENGIQGCIQSSILFLTESQLNKYRSQHSVRMLLCRPLTFLLQSSLPNFSPTLALSPKCIIY
ncbi:hypothetical protein PILCRDRAFT_85535 [Piloderma croceum F 1598]|uniref:Uncharacterized protein n=1 Tax=Piloderma croceum (strain F 1598) TaxID=765440 RepID=A0A0C3FV85_PILCF|nr:hypothetical protein PILCRDRAFT_85535 [Piloderma croceum F 1598]